jgi:C4-dicarboxylate transporter DctM subunit
VADVFLAGLSAGGILVILLAAYCYGYARFAGLKTAARTDFAQRMLSTRRAVLPLGLPALIFGGIYGGVFTPTEAAAAACVYAAVIETAVFRRLPLRDLFAVSRSSAITISTLLILISAGGAMTWFLTLERVPAMMAAMMSGVSPGIVLLMINLLFLLVGMFIDPNSAVIVISPLIAPTAAAIGVDPVHLGAIVVFNLAIGMISPPFGLNIFIGMTTFQIGYMQVVRNVLPFIGITLVALMVVTYVPAAILWLPSMGG